MLSTRLLLGTASFALGLTLQASAQAYYPQPLPIKCEGPSCFDPPSTDDSSLQFQDTSVIRRDDGKYFRYSKGNHTGLGLNVVTAPSLKGPWNYAYDVLGGPLKSSCGAANGHNGSWRWAPEVHFINGLYYLYYTVENPDGGNTCFDQCVATSTSMEPGSWKDHGSMNIPIPDLEKASNGDERRPYVRLDGNLLANASDPQGIGSTKYMVLGSFGFGIYGFPLSDDMLTIKAGAKPQLIIADQYQVPVPGSNDQRGNYTEGPYQLAHGNWIYLFYSRGSCCAADADVASVYQTQVCRTQRSNGPTGPYVDRDGQNCATGGSQGYHRKGSTFLYSNNQDPKQASVYSPGSVGVINDPTEGLCMWYQYKDNTANQKTLGFGFNYLSFDGDEWPILTATR